MPMISVRHYDTIVRSENIPEGRIDGVEALARLRTGGYEFNRSKLRNL